MQNSDQTKLGILEALTLEELFFDQLHFKLEALLSIKTFGRKEKAKIDSFIHQIDELTKENIKELKTCAGKK